MTLYEIIELVIQFIYLLNADIILDNSIPYENKKVIIEIAAITLIVLWPIALYRKKKLPTDYKESKAYRIIGISTFLIFFIWLIYIGFKNNQI